MNQGIEKQAIKRFLRSFLRAHRHSRATSRSGVGDVAEKVPKIFRKSISEKDYKRVWKGYRDSGGGNLDSMIAYLPTVVAEKVFGPKKVRNTVWRKINAPTLVADTAIGNVLSKTPLVGKKLFTVKENIPWAKNTLREVERRSALAPLVKARNIGTPIIVGVGLEKGFHKAHEAFSAAKKREEMKSDQELREKVASTMLRLNDEVKGHTKRAHALRLIYKQAEMGVGCVPQSYSELEEKLASLLNQDLVVYEKALELAGGSIKLGELSSSDIKNLNALEQFQAAVLGDDA